MADKHAIEEGRAGALGRLQRTFSPLGRSRPLIRSFTLGPAAPRALIALPRRLRPGDPALARLLLAGRLIIAGERADLAGGHGPWGGPAATEALGSWLHRMSWLRDLAALNEADARDRARALLDGWNAAAGRHDELAWRPEIIAARLTAQLDCADILLAGGAPGAGERLAQFARQLRRLETSAASAAEGQPRLCAALGLAIAAACAPDSDRALDAGLALASAEAERQILPDGGHVSRNPAALLDILADLRALEGALRARGRQAPQPLRRAIDRLSPMLRVLRMPDGGLASFQGGGEGDRALIAAALACEDGKGRAFGIAPHSGFHRVEAGGCVLVLDTGRPAEPPYGADAHASPLAFELAAPSGRLIVNCGWAPDSPSRLRQAVRATAAHSTLTLEDTNAMRLSEAGGRREAKARPAPPPSARRNEEERGVWLEASHEGYREAFGLVHLRRLFVAADGADIRGEDMLFRPIDDPAPSGARATTYAARFHLHPGVRASLGRDGRSALLTLPGGEGWRFRTDTGPLRLEESIYLAAGGRARETRQLVVTGAARADAPMDRPPNRLRWALQRLGRAPIA